MLRRISVRSSAESPSRICAARPGSICSRITLLRRSVGWSQTSIARGTESRLSTAAASWRVSWFTRSATSAGCSSATTSPMPAKLSSRRSRMRSSSSSGALTLGGLGSVAASLPAPAQLLQQLHEARVRAQRVELGGARDQRVVLVSDLDRPLQPLERLVDEELHRVELRQPQRDVVVGGRDLAHPVADERRRLRVLPAHREALREERQHAVEVRV